MDVKIFRNRLFGAFSDMFPQATVAFMPPSSFLISQNIDGQRLTVPVEFNPAEASAKNPDVIIGVYALAARKSWDQAIASRVPKQKHATSELHTRF